MHDTTSPYRETSSADYEANVEHGHTRLENGRLGRSEVLAAAQIVQIAAKGCEALDQNPGHKTRE